jgi:hypothetical protein
MRLNATPTAIAQMFCQLHPTFSERFVRKQLENGKWKKMLRKECMCEHCLKLDSIEEDLRSFVKVVLELELDDDDRTGLEMTDEQLGSALDSALEFIRYKYPTHVLSTAKAQAQADAAVAAEQAGAPAAAPADGCDGCATHCCKWAMSCGPDGKSNPPTDDGPFCSACDADHSMSCGECSLIFHVLEELDRRVAARRERVQV